MKKFVGMLSLVAVLFAMVGCVRLKGNEEKIVGKWWMVAESEDGVNWDNHVMRENVVCIIEKNGTLTNYEHFNTDDVDFDGTANWRRDGDKMIIDGDEFSIKKLTNEEMVLEFGGHYGRFEKME